jgi:hypothetical protein
MSGSMLFHGGGPMSEATGEVGSQLYDLMPEHIPALWAMGLVLGAGILSLRWGRGARLEAFRGLPLRMRVIFALLLISGAAHAGLALAATGGWRILFGGSAVAATLVVLRIVDGKTWRRWAGLLLAGSLVGYWIELVGGHPADQIGMLVKVVEVFGLYLVMLPNGSVGGGVRPGAITPSRFRRAAAPAGLVVIAVLNATAAWAGAFQSAAGDTNVLDHHSHGGITPGMVMNAGGPTGTSLAQQTEANQLWVETSAFVARYSDPMVAAADGYQVERIAGNDFHAPNPVYQKDGLVLDPTRPENLIYGMGPDGPVLLGVMFETEGLKNDPPSTGGAALDWHRHEQVCFSLAPPGIAGLVDPYGNCPAGSLAAPTTNSMMHVWTIPGTPTRFGDLDEDWKQRYLDGLEG